MKVELTEALRVQILREAEARKKKISSLAIEVYPTMPHDKAKSKLWRQLKDNRYRYIERDVLMQLGIILKLTLNF